jgi:ribosomal protein L17
MREIIEALVAKARKGDIAAARTLFDRVLGKPLEPDIIERIERLEARHGI